MATFKVGLDDYLAGGGLTIDLAIKAQDLDKIPINDRIIDSLAALNQLAYEQTRSSKADELGIRVSVLDKIVAKRRADIDAQTQAQQTHTPLATEPVDGAGLVETLITTILIYVVLPAPAKETALIIVLWILHTWCLKKATYAPRMMVSSPIQECGKTNLMTLLLALSDHPTPAANMTVSAVFREIEAEHPTLLIDEFDTIKDTPYGQELRGVLNSGHARAFAHVIRTEGDGNNRRNVKYSTWAPMAISGIRLHLDKVWSTLISRSHVIVMQRKRPNEKVGKLRDKTRQQLRDRFAPLLARWAADHLEQISDDPQVPEELSGRGSDNADPLLAIADVIGGDVPTRARAALRALAKRNADPATSGITILADLRMLFDTSKQDELGSAQICEELAKLEDRPWKAYGKRAKPITQIQLAALLKPYLIVSKPTGDARLKGYHLKDCVDTFARYLLGYTPTRAEAAAAACQSDDEAPNSGSSETPEEAPSQAAQDTSQAENSFPNRSTVQPQRAQGVQPLLRNVHKESLNASENGISRHGEKGLNGRTVQNGNSEGINTQRPTNDDDYDEL